MHRTSGRFAAWTGSWSVVGEEIDTDYGAPTSGGPPFEVYEMGPHAAFEFPTQDDLEPTRWTFPGSNTW